MINFHQQLVLNRWMMGFFRGGTLHALENRLGEDRHEGMDEDGQTGFFHELHQNLCDSISCAAFHPILGYSILPCSPSASVLPVVSALANP